MGARGCALDIAVRTVRMRFRISIVSLLLFGTAVVATLSVAAPNQRRIVASAETGQNSAVDVELALAVDVSYSMETDEQKLQREGYAEAITSPEFLQMVKSGQLGRIAISYFEWAASGDVKLIVKQRIIDGPDSANLVGMEILSAPLRRASRTSISGAINFSVKLFGKSEYHAARRVIDISGDGPNNSGEIVTAARDKAVALGITINGLPIMTREPSSPNVDIKDLDIYYEDCVIGGPGAFAMVIKSRDQFKAAIKRKLVQEVAKNAIKLAVIPVENYESRISCTIGEEMQRGGEGPL